MALVVMGYGAMLGMKLPRTGWVSERFGVWCSWVDGVAAARDPAWVRAYRDTVTRIVAVDAGTGKVRGTVCTRRGLQARDMKVSPDGKHIAFAGPRNRVEWISTKSGRVEASTTGGEFRSGHRTRFIVGIEGMGEALWVYFAAADAMRTTSRLLRWRPATDEQEVVIQEPAYETVGWRKGNVPVARRYGLLRRPEGLGSISAPDLVEISAGAMPKVVRIHVRNSVEPGALATRSFNVRGLPGGGGSMTVTPDGAKAFFVDDLYLEGSPQTAIYNLRSGEREGGLEHASVIRGVEFDPGNSRRMFVTGVQSVLVRDLLVERWMARLRYPEGYGPSAATVSADGRLMVSVGTKSLGRGLGAPFLQEVFVHDLTEIQE